MRKISRAFEQATDHNYYNIFQKTATIECPGCGAPNADNNESCEYCSRPFGNSSNPTTINSQPQQQQTQQQQQPGGGSGNEQGSPVQEESTPPTKALNGPTKVLHGIEEAAEDVAGGLESFEASYKKQAEAWPSEIDHRHHIQEMHKLMMHHDMGEHWHVEHGDLESARKHAEAADALRDAMYACERAM